jgi:hypothetical protein
LGWILGQKRAISRIKIEKNREKSTKIFDRFVDYKRVTGNFGLVKGKITALIILATAEPAE